MYGLEDRGLLSARAQPPRRYRLWGPPSQRCAAAVFVHSVVSRQVYVLNPQYGTGAYFFHIWKQCAASDRAGRASRKLSVVLNFRPSRCEPLKANPCLQFPIEPLKVRCENVTTHLHLALMLRMRGAIHSLPHTSS